MLDVQGRPRALAKCKKFQKLPSWRRREQVRKMRACFRYLGPNHSMASCSSTIRCRYCLAEHNSLLHLDVGEIAPSQDRSNKPASTSPASKSLETAQVTSMMIMTTVRFRFGSLLYHRKRVVQQFALRRRKAHVSGLQGLKVGRSTQAVSLRIGSEYSAKSMYLPTALFWQT